MIVNWKFGKPAVDGLYLVTMEMTVNGEKQAWTVIKRLTDGEWETSCRITAWDDLPEPYREGSDV